MKIRQYQPGDQFEVVELWKACGLVKPWNDPTMDIARKLSVSPELFLVGTVEGNIVASVMGGYDGHRGWINYLAVSPGARNRGYGRKLMAYVEKTLVEEGCPKINLQIRESNLDAIEFYRAIGYEIDPVASMGKRLIADD
jgi:ribosomal protein S18 acetylase RimI-like enzyme